MSSKFAVKSLAACATFLLLVGCSTQAETAIPRATNTPTQTATSTSSPTATSTFIATTTDLASDILLQDDFIDNRNGWLLLETESVKSNIIGGKYKHTITCPQTHEEFYCRNDIKVPSLSSKDLQLELDATMKNISPSTEVMIIFQFRVIDSNNYYSVYFRSIGKYKMNRFDNGSSDTLLEETTIPNFSPNTDTVNRYGFSAGNTFLKPLFNGQELLSVEDRVIDQGGSVNIVIVVSRGGSAIVELDNLIATDKSK